MTPEKLKLLQARIQDWVDESQTRDPLDTRTSFYHQLMRLPMDDMIEVLGGVRRVKNYERRKHDLPA